MLEESFLLLETQLLSVFERSGMVVLCSTQVDDARAYFHAVEFAEGIFRAGIVDILAETEASRVAFTRFFD